MKGFKRFSILWSLAAAISACAVQPVALEEPGLHPADARAPAAKIGALTWRAEQHGTVAAPAATVEHRHEHHAHEADDTHVSEPHASDRHEHDEAGTDTDTGTGTGTVIDVDRQSARVTLDHGDIAGLMPAMQMTFDIDPALLDGVRAETEVQFSVRQGERRGQFVITELETLSDAPHSGERPEGHHDHGHVH